MNVLLITTDQQRADTLGVEGSPLGATPRLDAFAAQGTRFSAARTQNPLCQPARATILTGTYPSTHGVTCNGIDLPADAERALGRDVARPRRATAPRSFGKAHFADERSRSCPTGQVESVEGSARVRPDWNGPYFGFEHVELTLFGHNLRIADLMGRWNWCFGPPPFGLHYARYLFRDGAERGYERLATDAARGRRREVGPPPDVAQRAARGGSPHDVGRRPRVRMVAQRRRSVLRLGELHRSAPPDGPARAVVRSLRAGRRARGAAGRAPRRARRRSRRCTSCSRRACAGRRWSGRTRAARR